MVRRLLKVLYRMQKLESVTGLFEDVENVHSKQLKLSSEPAGKRGDRQGRGTLTCIRLLLLIHARIGGWGSVVDAIVKQRPLPGVSIVQAPWR